MRTMRAFVGLLAALAASLTLASPIAPAQAAGPDRLPFNIVNQSQRGEEVFLYVVGVNLSTGRLGSVEPGRHVHPVARRQQPAQPGAGRLDPDGRLGLEHDAQRARAASPDASTCPSASGCPSR